MRLRFGALVGGLPRPDHDTGLQLLDTVDLAALAERLGLEEFWWRQHDVDSGVIDPVAVAAFAAARTSRVLLGADIPMRHDPAAAIRSASQLSQLAPGRVAVALSAAAVHHRATDAPEQDALREALHLAATTSVDLRVGAADVVRARVAGSAGARLHVPAAVLASSMGAVDPLDEIAHAAGEAAVAAGRAARTPLAVLTPVHVATSELGARRQVSAGIAAQQARRVGPEAHGAHPDSVIDLLHSHGTGVVGTAEMAIEHLEKLLESAAEIGTVLIELPGWADHHDTAASLELVARAVVPWVRRSVAHRAVVTTRDAPASERRHGRRARLREIDPSLPGHERSRLPTPARGLVRESGDGTGASRPPGALPQGRTGRHAAAVPPAWQARRGT